MSRERDATKVVADPRDASTVLLLRDAQGGGFEVFLVKRHQKSAFMGGVHVFPGGKVDIADSDSPLLTRAHGRSLAETREALGEHTLSLAGGGSLFACAVRETFEESGVFLGEAADRAQLVQSRTDAGRSFFEKLVTADATMAFDRLIPWTRWITPTVEPKRYDTRFFLAEVDARDNAAHDTVETTEELWSTPAEALRLAEAGTIALAPPTQRSLEMLASFDSARAAIQDARGRRPPRIQPHFTMDGDLAVLALPGDRAHPDPTSVLPGATRFELRDGRWWAR